MSDAATLAVTARLLRQAARVDALSCALTVVAFAAGWMVLDTGQWPRLAIFLLVIALGLAQRYFALRVAFDAALFEALARGEQLSTQRMDEFDQAMQSLDLLPPDRSGRAWTQRCRGAVSMLRWQVAIALLQFLVGLAGIVATVWT